MMFDTIRKFADSTNFANAIKISIAAGVPYIVCSYLAVPQVGFALAIGAFLAFPSDVPGNIKHKINGVILAATIVAACYLMVNLLHPYPIALYPVLAASLFLLSMISVYGHRANMVSFSGLLSLVIAFAHLQQGWNILLYTAVVFLGGIFYLMISLLFHFLRPRRYTELQIAECVRLTAKYLKLRGDLWDANANRAKIVEKQLILQVKLNDIHQNLRELLIRQQHALKTEHNQKMLLVFISSIEIIELALSTSFDHSKLHEKFQNHPSVLYTYQNLAYSLSSQLKQIAQSVQNSQIYVAKQKLGKNLRRLAAAITDYENAVGKEAAADGVWMLTNMFHYAQHQVDKIRTIEKAFTTGIDKDDLTGKDSDLEKFLTPIKYPWSTLRQNLNLSSSIFRHSLRLTITILAGFIVGSLFPLQNIYWILLTIVVIMRPEYGLTKARVLQRIVGTIAGGLIAFAILGAVDNHIFIGTIAVIAMIFGYAFTNVDYKVSVAFVTMYVVFLYGMLTPDIESVVGFRILDTVIGGGLAFIANYILWPSWEFLNVPAYLKKAIEANRDYLSEISAYYNAKGSVTTSYRLARKNAFVGVGNLMASFQRMSQEPKSKQKQISELYELAVLNHTVLSSAASLGTYIQSHMTTSASKAFNDVVDAIIHNLNNAVMLLNLDGIDNVEHVVNQNDLAMRFAELKEVKSRELRNRHLSNDQEYELRMQEVHLVLEQLVWLSGLSEKIVAAARQLKVVK
jgi:uncharacterized membrane protein (TIGR01666 family)